MSPRYPAVLHPFCQLIDHGVIVPRIRLWVQEALQAGRFKKYQDKIIHIIAPEPQWDLKSYFRADSSTRVDWKRSLAIQLGVRPQARRGDIILIGDIDEIPRKEALQLIKNCQLPRQGCFLSNMYAYGYDSLLSPGWPNPKWTTLEDQTDVQLANLR